MGAESQCSADRILGFRFGVKWAYRGRRGLEGLKGLRGSMGFKV